MPYNDNAANWNQAMQTSTAAAGIMATAKTNQKDRAFAREMSDRSRQWALDDWYRNNFYNSPQQQMERFKAAGLNPALIYGQTNMAAPVKSTETPQNFRSTPPNFAPLQNALISSYDMRQKEAQTDLLRKQLEIADKDIQLKSAQTFKTLTDTDRSKIGVESDQFDLAKKNSLLPFDLQYAEQNAYKKELDALYTLDQNAREWMKIYPAVELLKENIRNAQQNRSLSEAQERMVNQQIENLKTDGNIKKMTENLNKAGVTWNDEMWQRMALKFAEKFGAKY